jgi:5-methylcytosine-specific restriction endonuclease McrA
MTKRGTYKRTDEHRAITSLGLKRFYANGGVVWSKGKQFSDTHISRLKQSHIGVISKVAKPSICCNCHKQYYKKDCASRRKSRKYCSFSCYVKSITGISKPTSGVRGPKNHKWRGGITSENRKIRASAEYAKWRSSVFVRDNFTCTFCGVVGGYLEADHIKPFAYFRELRFKPENGRTLCKPCHATTDTYMGRAVQKMKEYAK